MTPVLGVIGHLLTWGFLFTGLCYLAKKLNFDYPLNDEDFVSYPALKLKKFQKSDKHNEGICNWFKIGS